MSQILKNHYTNRFFKNTTTALVTAISLVVAIYGCSTNANASAPKIKPDDLRKEFQTVSKQNKSLKYFYKSIEKKYGNEAITPLLSVINNEHESDEFRWASLFSLAKLSGEKALGVYKKFMNHKSWVMRDAAIKSSTAACQSSPSALSKTACTKSIASDLALRLKDPSLIVRTSAVDAISDLGLKELSSSLLETLSDRQNFNKGHPLWIQNHTLTAIENLELHSSVPELADYLSSQKDEKLQHRIIQTLEKLTGREYKEKSLKEQVYLWKRSTTADKTF